MAPAHSFDYCDKNLNTKEPKYRDERSAKRNARKKKKQR